MNLHEWAARHGVSAAAIQDLEYRIGMGDLISPVQPGESEAAIQIRVRLEASKKGLRLWRNNVGGTYTNDGRFIRYGLANESERMNRSLKSSDLIGIRPVTIQQGHVGVVIGQFVAREVKATAWHYTGTDREQAQLSFLQLVASMGGDAAFTNAEGSL